MLLLVWRLDLARSLVLIEITFPIALRAARLQSVSLSEQRELISFDHGRTEFFKWATYKTEFRVVLISNHLAGVMARVAVDKHFFDLIVLEHEPIETGL